MAAERNTEMIMKLVREFVKRVRKENFGIQKVYLFGSHTTGHADEYSDIDVALVANEWHPDKFEAQFKLMLIASKIDTRIEPHLFRNSEFDETHPFAQEILTHGVLVFEADRQRSQTTETIR